MNNKIEKLIQALTSCKYCERTLYPDMKHDQRRKCPCAMYTHNKEQAESLIKEGYINGADFVEWLKENFIVATWDRKGNLVKLAEALQEYLKGE